MKYKVGDVIVIKNDAPIPNTRGKIFKIKKVLPDNYVCECLNYTPGSGDEFLQDDTWFGPWIDRNTELETTATAPASVTPPTNYCWMWDRNKIQEEFKGSSALGWDEIWDD